jgi:uncharacterized repeat protein (TIGR01451 family)
MQLVTAGFSAAALLAFTLPLGAQAAPLTPATAEGDSAAVSSVAAIGGGSAINVGPVAPSSAVVPPGATNASQTGTVISGPSGPLNPTVSALNVTNDTSKATLVPVGTTDCQPNQTLQDGFTGPLSGGNGCSTIANAEALNSGTPQAPTPLVKATGVFAQSTTQQCDPGQGLPTGSVKVASLHIGPAVGGVDVTIPNPIPPNTRIQVTLPTSGVLLASVILNEQKLENLSGGQGLEVNAIHVITGPGLADVAVADLIIGHTHSNATCTTKPSQQPCAVAGSSDPRCQGVVITKTDNTTGEMAKPGQTITYTLSIDTSTASNIDGNCLVRRVVDTLPPGFAFVSASGDLGTPTKVVGQDVTWFSASGFTSQSGTLVETVVAKIADNEANGSYSNQVEVLSTCGANPGSSAPIQINVTPVATAPPVLPKAGGAAGSGAMPFTGTAAPDAAVWLGVILFGLVLSAVAATRIIRKRPID